MPGYYSPQCNGTGETAFHLPWRLSGGPITVSKFVEASMHSKTFFWLVRAWIVVLALGTIALGQYRSPVHIEGVINDFTPAHDATGKLSGPWELHGVWRMDLGWSGHTATFSAALTMEDSDYWILNNPNPPADPDSPATRTPHTHHITMWNAQVISDPSLVSSGCPTASYKPPTTTGFMISGSASISGNGGFPPFAPQGQLSPLTVCVTGGTQVGFSNITLVFGAPASGHFGSQAINGVVRVPE